MEDDEIKKPPQYALGQSLDTLSVDELLELAALLRAEAERLELEAQGKQGSRDAAAALFKI